MPESGLWVVGAEKTGHLGPFAFAWELPICLEALIRPALLSRIETRDTPVFPARPSEASPKLVSQKIH